MINIDTALEEMKVIKQRYNEFYKTDITESDTRSKLIDFMFINILGWTESDISREEKVDSGYYDYMFSTPDFSFVVEAKKLLKDFELPAAGQQCTLGALEKGNKEVINQIRSYLIDKSLAFGVITNGKQFIIGKFVNTTGADWRKVKVHFYRNLEEIESNFIFFHNLISKQSIVENRTIDLYEEKEKPQILIDTFRGNGDQVLVRNDFSSSLGKVIQEAFSELSSEDSEYEKKLLDNCYVVNADIKKYNTDLEVVFLDNPPGFDDKIAPVRNTDSVKKQLRDKISDDDHSSEINPIIIVIGGKGVGKTTFIKYFFSSLPRGEKLSRPTVYIDLRNSTEQDIKDTESMCKRILENLKDAYPDLSLHTDGVLRQIYHKELKEKKEGIWKHLSNEKFELDRKISSFFEDRIKENVSHLEAISKYLKDHCSKKICLVFDNADQLEDPAQKAAFLLAGSLQRKLKGIIIISLREGYYYKWKNKPPFDAFMSTVYHISAPPYREVIKKRLEYVTKFFKFKEIQTEVNNKKLTLTPDGFKDLFSNLHHTLFDDNGSAVLEFLEETSYPNIRSGLDKLNSFLVSGHSKLFTYMTKEKYKIPIWEFAKSIALESRLYYRHDKSILFNLFYPSLSGRSHFLKIRILYFLYECSDGIVHQDKYISVKEVLDVFKVGDFQFTTMIEELNLLLLNNLIDTMASASDVETIEPISELSSVKITYKGSYYLNKILNEFYYYDLMLQDTPIFSESHYSKIKSTFPESGSISKSELSKRYETVTIFLDYLKNENEKEMKRLSKEGGAKCLSIDIFKECLYSEKLKRSLAKVENKLVGLQLPFEKK